MKWYKKIAALTLLSGIVFGFSALALSPALVSADAVSKTDVCNGLSQLNGSETCSTAGNSTFNYIVTIVVDILSCLVVILAVVMLIISGFRYVTSRGDSGNISSAKNTLIYAIVGVISVALAQLIVHFAISQSVTAANCPAGETTAQCASK